jgi:hypothetical protein
VNPTQSISVGMAQLMTGYSDLQKTIPSLPHIADFSCELLMAIDGISIAYWTYERGARNRIVTNRRVVTEQIH